MGSFVDEEMREAALRLEAAVRYRPVDDIVAGGERLRRLHTARMAAGGAMAVVLAAGVGWSALGSPHDRDRAIGPPLTASRATALDGSTETVGGRTKTAPADLLLPGGATVVSYLPPDGNTVGVGQPISLVLTTPPTPADRVAVEKAMIVTTTPHVEGAWHWVGPQRMDWRPRDFWAPGTKVSVSAVSGTFSFTVGRSVVSTVDLSSDIMTIALDGKMDRHIPVTGGLPSHPTSTGTMVVLDKRPSVKLTASASPPTVYTVTTQWAVKLTASGQYIYAAPWADAQFGKLNSTHGDIAMSTDSARWFYGLVIPGDVVRVIPSGPAAGPPVVESDGFGDWNLDWQEWLAGSAAGVQTDR